MTRTPFTGELLGHHLRQLGLVTHAQAAQLFGRSRPSISRIINGERRVPPEMECLVRLLRAPREDLIKLKEIVEGGANRRRILAVLDMLIAGGKITISDIERCMGTKVHF